jgi:sulfur carrier protein
MHITVNGQRLEIEPGQTLQGLIESMSLDPGVVVAELNHDIVAGENFTSTSLAPGDQLELLSFVGGG